MMEREEQDRLPPRARLLAVIEEWGADKTSTTRMTRVVDEYTKQVRAEALEAAADAIERGSVLSQYGAHGWLRARAADERGGR